MATIQKRIKKDGTVVFKAVIRVKGYPTMTASFDKKTSAQKWIGQHEPLMKEGKHITDYEAKKILKNIKCSLNGGKVI